MTYLLVLMYAAVAITVTRHLRQPLLAACLIAGALAVFVAARGADVSNDFTEYQEWYRIGSDAEGLLERPPILEALFLWLMTAGHAVGLPFRAFLWVIAVSAIGLKFYSIQRVAHTHTALFAGVACYLLTGFLLHDFTQLRMGLAVGFFMLSLVYLGEGRTLAFLAATGMGLLIHSAALLGLIAWPLSRPRRGRFDTLLLVLLGVAIGVHALGIFSLANVASLFSQFDARLDLYAQLASSGINEAADPYSVRTALVVLLVALGYVTLIRADRGTDRPARAGQGPKERAVQDPQQAMVTLLRLIVVSQIALFLLADVKEVAVRVMEFLMACLPLYVARLSQSRGGWLPSAVIALWVLATFVNYVFRTPTLVGPYTFG